MSRNEFKQFQYINYFIEYIDFSSLNLLNFATHNSSLKKRKIEDIKKYFGDNISLKYDNLVNFFKKLLNVYEFIELYLKFYKSRSEAEKQFQLNYINFSDVYTLKFSEIYDLNSINYSYLKINYFY